MKCSNCEKYASSWCVDCSELICTTCVDAHQRIKATRCHVIIEKESIATTDIMCTNCADGTAATSWCTDCVSFICELCSNAHLRIQSTRSHGITSKQFLSDQLVSKNDSSDIMRTVAPEQRKRTESPNFIDLVTGTSECDQPTTSQLLQFSSADAPNRCDAPKENMVTENSANDEPTTSNSTGSRQWFDLKMVLKETTQGRDILTFYESNRKLLPKHRKKMIRLIWEKVYSTQKETPPKEREEIARQIGLVFMTEQKVIKFLN